MNSYLKFPAVLACTTLFAAGCAQRTSEREQPPVTQPGEPMRPTEVGVRMPRTAERISSDAQISGVLNAANQEEISLARLALEKASDPEVKQFAQKILGDHSALDQRSQELWTRLSVQAMASDLQQQIQSDADAAQKRFQTLEGVEFDRAYLEQEVNFHQQLLTHIDQQLMPGAQNEDVKSLLTSARSSVSMHLTEAKALRDRMQAAPRG